MDERRSAAARNHNSELKGEVPDVTPRSVTVRVRCLGLVTNLKPPAPASGADSDGPGPRILPVAPTPAGGYRPSPATFAVAAAGHRAQLDPQPEADLGGRLLR